MVHSKSFGKLGLGPNPATYSLINASLTAGSASPAMGAIYSFLALRYVIFSPSHLGTTTDSVRSLPDLQTITLPSGTLGNSKSRSITNVPVIVGALFGALGGLIFIAAVVFFVRRRRKSKAAHIDSPIEEFGVGPQDPSTISITPFTDEIKPPMSHGGQEQNSGDLTQNADTSPGVPPHTTKVLRILSPDPMHQTVGEPDSIVADGGNPAVSSRDEGNSAGDDGNLRREMEQLRRVVETLSAQQAQQQPQVPVYQQDSLPDEPPPMYPN
jgi:hypothetical protein